MNPRKVIDAYYLIRKVCVCVFTTLIINTLKTKRQWCGYEEQTKEKKKHR